MSWASSGPRTWSISGSTGNRQHHREIRRVLAPPGGGEAEDGPPERARQHHRDEHPDGGLPTEVGGRAEGQPDDEQRDGEAHAGQRRSAEDAAHPDSLRQPPDAEPDGGPGGQADAEELSEDEPDDDAPRDARGDGLAEEAAPQVHTCVGEREDRDDQERGRQAQVLVQALVDRGPLGEAAGDLPSRRCAGRLPEVPEQLPCRDHLVPLRRIRRDEQASRHTRERGVHAGGDGGEPQNHDDEYVRRRPPLTGTPQQPQADEAGHGEQERPEVDLLAVDQTDDRHRQEVVDHGEGEQEDPELARETRPDDRQRPE